MNIDSIEILVIKDEVYLERIAFMNRFLPNVQPYSMARDIDLVSLTGIGDGLQYISLKDMLQKLYYQETFRKFFWQELAPIIVEYNKLAQRKS